MTETVAFAASMPGAGGGSATGRWGQSSVLLMTLVRADRRVVRDDPLTLMASPLDSGDDESPDSSSSTGWQMVAVFTMAGAWVIGAWMIGVPVAAWPTPETV